MKYMYLFLFVVFPIINKLFSMYKHVVHLEFFFLFKEHYYLACCPLDYM